MPSEWNAADLPSRDHPLHHWRPPVFSEHAKPILKLLPRLLFHGRTSWHRKRQVVQVAEAVNGFVPPSLLSIYRISCCIFPMGSEAANASGEMGARCAYIAL